MKRPTVGGGGPHLTAGLGKALQFTRWKAQTDGSAAKRTVSPPPLFFFWDQIIFSSFPGKPFLKVDKKQQHKKKNF